VQAHALVEIVARRGHRVELFKRSANNLLFADPSEQGFNLGPFLRGNWKQRRASAAAVVAVEVACVLDAADAQLADDALAGIGDAFLLFSCQLQVVILPCQVDFLACLRGAGGEAQDATRCAGFECVKQDCCRAGENLEADFFAPRLDGGDRRRGS
jgi:hypothetical protein